MAGLPLAGVRVLDFARAVAGPLAGQLLGDLGADVIKVEPLTGEGYRGRLYPTTDPRATSNPRFEAINRNKRSLAIDLKAGRGVEILHKLISTADVIIESYRPGTPERMGWGYEQCKALNERIIFVSLSGWGETGPYRNRAGADIWAQSLAGNISIQGSPGGEPMIGGTLFVDHGEALAVAFGVMSALFRREREGAGCEVQANLLDTALFLQTSSSLTDYLNGEELVTKSGRGWAAGFPYGAYTASDGEIVTMHTSEEQWKAFIGVLGLEELASDERFATQELRVAHRHDLYPILDKAFSKRTRKEWSEAFAKTRAIRADPALRYDEMVEDPQVQENETIVPVPHPTLGSIVGIAGPVRVAGTRSDLRLGPPGLGQHTSEILSELGYEEQTIDELLASDVVFRGTGTETFGSYWKEKRNQFGVEMST